MKAWMAVAALILAVPASAQTLVPGALTWTHERTPDLTHYRVRVDAQPAVDLGLPATNEAPLALTPGAHTLIVEACYQVGGCLPASAVSVSVVDPNAPPAPVITNLSPASGTAIKAVATGFDIVVSGTVTDATRVELRWQPVGGTLTVIPCDATPAPHGCTRSTDQYTFRVRIGGAWLGTRNWSLRATGDGGVTTGPTRSVVVY